ncbi:hypothetical protein Tco_1133969 [Tanacetum coccineum]
METAENGPAEILRGQHHGFFCVTMMDLLMADFHHFLDDAKDICVGSKSQDLEGMKSQMKMRIQCSSRSFWTLEIDVKGGSSYDLRVPAAPTHSAFISAASTNSKWSTADSKCQPSFVSYTTTSSSADASGNVLENVLHSFVAERYEDGDVVIPAVDAADGVSSNDIFADGVFVATGNDSDGVSVAAGVGADGVSVTSSDATDVETQFALMVGLSHQAKSDNMNNKVKLKESEARFDKWKNSSKNLNKLINSSMSSRSKFGLGYGDTFGTDEVFDLSAPSIFDSCLKDAKEKPSMMICKSWWIDAVPGPKPGTFMHSSNKPDIVVHSLPMVQNCDFYENQLRLNNVPVWKNVENIPSIVPRPAYVPAGSRNRPTSVYTDRPFPAGWHNPAARPMTRPKSHYFQLWDKF